jgi:hypothetical protein
MGVANWPYSPLLSRALDPPDLQGPGPYMTIQVGGPLDGVVMLTADAAAQTVSVVSRWGDGTTRREQSAVGLDMAAAEALAGRWADNLGAGHKPVAASPPRARR